MLLICALSVHKSEENNDKDNSCFNFNRGFVNLRSEGPAGLGSEYVVANLTHRMRKRLHVSGPDPIEDIVVQNTSFLLKAGQEKVIELIGEGEVADGNPRELTIAFDGTVVDTAIGKHQMFYLPSRNITRDQWRCWMWSEPLRLGNLEKAQTKFCENVTEAGNGIVLSLTDTVELVVEKHWRRPHFSGNEDTECSTSQFPRGRESVSHTLVPPSKAGTPSPSFKAGTPSPSSKTNVEVRHGFNITQVGLTEGEVTVVQMWYSSREPDIFQDQNPRNLSLLLFEEKVVWAGMALLEEKSLYNYTTPELGYSYCTWWTCERGNAARLPLPSGLQTSSTAKLPIYTFYSNEVGHSDMIIVSVMGDGKGSTAASHHNSFDLILLVSVLSLCYH